MPVGSVVCSRRPGGTRDEPAEPSVEPAAHGHPGRGRRRGGEPRLDRRRRRRGRPRRGAGARRRGGRVRTGAAADWAAAVGGASTQDFFDAASRGRRWREAPTATLRTLADQRSPHATAYAQALAEVTAAACDLGEPTMRVVGNASVAAAAQLSVVRPDAARPARMPSAAPLRAVGPDR